MKTNSPKNILLLIPQLSFGGAERVFHDQARELTRAGHHVRECVFQTRTRAVAFPTQHELIILEAPAAGASPLSKLQALRRRVAQVRQLKHDLRIDVCISHLEGADYVNLLSRGTGKIMLCIHNSKRHDPGYRGAVGWLRRRWLMPTLYRWADRVVTVSRDLGQEMIDYLGLPPRQVTTINNFLEPDKVLAQAAEPLPDPSEEALFRAGPVLLAVGRLDAEKNPLVLLPVLARLRAGGQPNLRLLLLGNGTQRAALVAEAQALGLKVWDGTAPAESRVPTPPPAGQPALADCDVVLLGFRSNPFQYLRRAAVSVLPSLTEGFPMGLCEALTCGLPVASADCPTGPREILAPATPATQYAAEAEWAEFGLLLPVLRPGAPDFEAGLEAWVAGLGELLGNPERRAHYVAQARRRAADFGPEPAMARWEALLQDSAAVL
ncbi:glycosyltransferase [uncultured Hymenobacter sp.]|uniref:glycosyltransferase n=1 Tax=uncultured Hymenobacter sp. TaxID=170016 RepID=UPI0035CA0142